MHTSIEIRYTTKGLANSITVRVDDENAVGACAQIKAIEKELSLTRPEQRGWDNEI